jgi:hypothetical protein
LLPYLGYDTLYARYRFDEAWDGPNNARLATQIPPVFTSPFQSKAAVEAGVTPYLAVLGPQSGWKASKGRDVADFSDGLSHTMCIIEVSDSNVNWLEPGDPPVQGDLESISKWLASVNSSHRPHCVFFDCYCTQLPTTATTTLVEALMTCNGGEDVNHFFKP